MSTRKGNSVTIPTTTKKHAISKVSNTRSIVKKADEQSESKKSPIDKITNMKEKPTKMHATPKNEKPVAIRKISNTTSHDVKNTTSAKATVKKELSTPTSTRISRTQFFPNSKNMYSNALKTSNNSKTGIKNSSIVKPTKNSNTKNMVKSIHSTNNDTSPDTTCSTTSERPRTATLRQGSIVNHNIVGPDAPLLKGELKMEKLQTSETEYKYEDDFDSYDSDFEADSSSFSSADLQDPTSSTSSGGLDELESSQDLSIKRISLAGTDEEKKFDSGTFEMPFEIKQHKHILDNINESIEKENAKANEDYENIQINSASLSDEGFEEAKSLKYINFLRAQQKNVQRKSMESKKKRGKEILSLIKLDTYSFTLFDMPLVPYEVFIKSYGRSNSVQTSVQTGDDNVSEKVQTDYIVNCSKWSQYPIAFSKLKDVKDPQFWSTYRNDFMGVGDQDTNAINNCDVEYNELHLNKFMSSAANVIENIFGESYLETPRNLGQNDYDSIFSDGYIKFNTTENNIFTDTIIKNVHISNKHPNNILSIHVKSVIHNLSKNEYKSIVCVWNILNVDVPANILISYGQLHCCSFGCSVLDIFAGAQDGTISVWNLNEKNMQVHLLPCYTTEIGLGHQSRVVSIHSYQDKVDDKLYAEETNEVLSLDEDGELIIWKVFLKNIQTYKSASKTKISQWGTITIIINFKVSLSKLYPDLIDLQCTDSMINNLNRNFLYVSTNYGFIIRYLLQVGDSNILKFTSESQLQSNCLEPCPFSQNYFFAGFSNGDINLYSVSTEKPLKTFSNKKQTETSKIELVQWSRNNPCVIYTKDDKNVVHIWNINESDLYSIQSIPFEENINSIKLSPFVENTHLISGAVKSFMVIATDSHLYLHLLNEEHEVQFNSIYEAHKNTFLNYVNRL